MGIGAIKHGCGNEYPFMMKISKTVGACRSSATSEALANYLIDQYASLDSFSLTYGKNKDCLRCYRVCPQVTVAWICLGFPFDIDRSSMVIKYEFG
jgi:hypothetical protein